MTQNVKAAGEALKHNLKLQPQLYGLTLEMSRYILVKKKTKKKRADGMQLQKCTLHSQRLESK